MDAQLAPPVVIEYTPLNLHCLLEQGVVEPFFIFGMAEFSQVFAFLPTCIHYAKLSTSVPMPVRVSKMHAKFKLPEVV